MHEWKDERYVYRLHEGCWTRRALATEDPSAWEYLPMRSVYAPAFRELGRLAEQIRQGGDSAFGLLNRRLERLVPGHVSALEDANRKLNDEIKALRQRIAGAVDPEED